MSASALPIIRLAETMVLCGSRAASRLASTPTGWCQPGNARRRAADHALLVAEGIGLTAAHGGDQRVGGAKIDANGTFVLMRCGALAGLGDLQ